MRISIGLLPQQVVCRYHGAKFMRKHKERTPFYVITHSQGNEVQRERVVWRCQIAGCPTVVLGEHDVEITYQERRLGRNYLRQL